MKTIKLYIFLATALLVAGCDNEQKPEPSGTIFDGYYWTNEAKNYEEPVSFHINTYAGSLVAPEEEWSSTCWGNLLKMERNESFRNEILSPQNMHIAFAPKDRGLASVAKDSVYNKTVLPFDVDFTNKQAAAIVDSDEHRGLLFSFCRIDGGITITADKTLFGRSSGQNLSDKFVVTASHPYYRVQFPAFSAIESYGENFGMTSDRYFTKDIALAQSRLHSGLYEIAFAEVPEEGYNEITFFISLPVTDYYNTFAYFRGDDPEWKGMTQVAQGSTTVYFGMTAQENWHKNAVRRLLRLNDEGVYW